jgi:hypothetical protein
MWEAASFLAAAAAAPFPLPALNYFLTAWDEDMTASKDVNLRAVATAASPTSGARPGPRVSGPALAPMAPSLPLPLLLLLLLACSHPRNSRRPSPPTPTPLSSVPRLYVVPVHGAVAVPRWALVLPC